ncbi:hypothetical protein KTE13_28935 [Burkholderia multivorans]|uniref:hypothetical protein n=1 Tax=Burkholderia multivorans TaxID=87883 RepID=UPI001C2337B0|nr:hypothetical protein [Burkholderia multivorans]MBU9403776.1 hypothetical protein [Burkholderia multivorans]
MTKYFVSVRNDSSIHALLKTLNADRTNPPVLPIGEPGSDEFVLIRCTSVETAAFGLLHFVPEPESAPVESAPIAAATIPLHLLAWIAETPDSSAAELRIL